MRPDAKAELDTLRDEIHDLLSDSLVTRLGSPDVVMLLGLGMVLNWGEKNDAGDATRPVRTLLQHLLADIAKRHAITLDTLE